MAGNAARHRAADPASVPKPCGDLAARAQRLITPAPTRGRLLAAGTLLTAIGGLITAPIALAVISAVGAGLCSLAAI